MAGKTKCRNCEKLKKRLRPLESRARRERIQAKKDIAIVESIGKNC